MPSKGAGDGTSQALAQLREEVSDLLSPDYDNDFNLLRWLQRCHFSVDQVNIAFR